MLAMNLRDQLLRLLRREGENFRPPNWTFVFEADDGRSYECDLGSAVEYATAEEPERRRISDVPYTRVSMRVRW